MGRVVFEIGIIKAGILFVFLFGAGMATAYVLQARQGHGRHSHM